MQIAVTRQGEESRHLGLPEGTTGQYLLKQYPGTTIRFLRSKVVGKTLVVEDTAQDIDANTLLEDQGLYVVLD